MLVKNCCKKKGSHIRCDNQSHYIFRVFRNDQTAVARVRGAKPLQTICSYLYAWKSPRAISIFFFFFYISQNLQQTRRIHTILRSIGIGVKCLVFGLRIRRFFRRRGTMDGNEYFILFIFYCGLPRKHFEKSYRVQNYQIAET